MLFTPSLYIHAYHVTKVSILSAGTFFGALLAYPMGDMVGRKRGIVTSCVVFSLGVGLQLDTRWLTFVVGRGKLTPNQTH
jgi:MFS family permease